MQPQSRLDVQDMAGGNGNNGKDIAQERIRRPEIVRTPLAPQHPDQPRRHRSQPGMVGVELQLPRRIVPIERKQNGKRCGVVLPCAEIAVVKTDAPLAGTVHQGGGGQIAGGNARPHLIFHPLRGVRRRNGPQAQQGILRFLQRQPHGGAAPHQAGRKAGDDIFLPSVLRKAKRLPVHFPLPFEMAGEPVKTPFLKKPRNLRKKPAPLFVRLLDAGQATGILLRRAHQQQIVRPQGTLQRIPQLLRQPGPDKQRLDVPLHLFLRLPVPLQRSPLRFPAQIADISFGADHLRRHPHQRIDLPFQPFGLFFPFSGIDQPLVPVGEGGDQIRGRFLLRQRQRQRKKAFKPLHVLLPLQVPLQQAQAGIQQPQFHVDHLFRSEYLRNGNPLQGIRKLTGQIPLRSFVQHGGHGNPFVYNRNQAKPILRRDQRGDIGQPQIGDNRVQRNLPLEHFKQLHGRHLPLLDQGVVHQRMGKGQQAAAASSLVRQRGGCGNGTDQNAFEKQPLDHLLALFPQQNFCGLAGKHFPERGKGIRRTALLRRKVYGQPFGNRARPQAHHIAEPLVAAPAAVRLTQYRLLPQRAAQRPPDRQGIAQRHLRNRADRLLRTVRAEQHLPQAGNLLIGKPGQISPLHKRRFQQGKRPLPQRTGDADQRDRIVGKGAQQRGEVLQRLPGQKMNILHNNHGRTQTAEAPQGIEHGVERMGRACPQQRTNGRRMPEGVGKKGNGRSPGGGAQPEVGDGPSAPLQNGNRLLDQPAFPDARLPRYQERAQAGGIHGAAPEGVQAFDHILPSDKRKNSVVEEIGQNSLIGYHRIR